MFSTRRKRSESRSLVQLDSPSGFGGGGAGGGVGGDGERMRCLGGLGEAGLGFGVWDLLFFDLPVKQGQGSGLLRIFTTEKMTNTTEEKQREI